MRRRIQDLGQKIEFLEGVSEFRSLRARIIREAGGRLSAADLQKRLRLKLQQRAYAEVIGVDPTQWARIKIGTDPIKDHQLSALLAHLDLTELGGVDLWTLPMTEFESVVREKGYGRFGGPGSAADLAARLRAFVGGGPTLRIIVVDSAGGARGIGDADDVALLPALTIGQRVRLEISRIESAGYLLVLSEDPGRRLVVLGSSSSSPWRVTAGETLILPSAKDTYPVGKPLGRHSLYGVLFAVKPPLPATLEDGGTGTGNLSAAATTALIAALDSADASPPLVGLLDYRVE